MVDEWLMWRVVLDERTRIPLHIVERQYRMEDLQDLHDWLDALDYVNKRAEERAERERKLRQ